MIHIGDNLDIMRDMSSASIDLIYLDPPFNTGKDFGAFKDSWGGLDGYLEFMNPRLKECHRVLKDTGSMYLHCDSKTSHYLKISMDNIFGIKQFQNDIAWCYTGPSGVRKRYPRKHDTILFYTKGKSWTFNIDDVRVPHSKSSLNRWVYSTRWGKHRPNPNGKKLEDWWKIPFINPMSKERTGYPTQKPLALLERIIKASSNEGDVVLDPFCGSGTTLVAAHKLGRDWIGIDISNDVIDIINGRLES